jgi:hypothetical protein
MNVANMASMLSVCSQELSVKANEIREVLGLQGGVDAGQKSPYQGLGETELAFQASNASLQPTFNSYNYLFKDIFTDIIKKWQIVAKDKAVKLPYSVLGIKSMKMLELSSPFTNSEFNVEVSIAPSTEERTSILQQLVQLKAIGQSSNGQAGITYAQYLYVYEKVMSGQIKAAYFTLSKIEAQQRAEARNKELQDQQANIQSQQESAMVKGQIDKANIQEKGKYQMYDTMLEKLLEMNKDLTLRLTEKTKEGESKGDEQLAQQLVAQNNQDVADLLTMTTSPEEDVMTEETMQM